MTDRRDRVGARGEQAAWELYRRRGFELVARNWRCSLGEIDLVLRRRDVLVFCEVKTRTDAGHGAGFEAVDGRKQRKLRALAQVFLLSHPSNVRSVRFDVASASIRARAGVEGGVSIALFEDAF